LSSKDLLNVDDNVILWLYNAGIVTGKGPYGVFDPDGPLTRAEAAALVSRLVEPELHRAFVPEDYVLAAAGIPSSTQLFENGVTAAEFFHCVNNAIALAEVNWGYDFDWNAPTNSGNTTILEEITVSALFHCDAAAELGNQAYRQLDLPTYYARLLALTGVHLGRPAET